MTYYVSSGTLNSTNSTQLWPWPRPRPRTFCPRIHPWRKGSDALWLGRYHGPRRSMTTCVTCGLTAYRLWLVPTLVSSVGLPLPFIIFSWRYNLLSAINEFLMQCSQCIKMLTEKIHMSFVGSIGLIIIPRHPLVGEAGTYSAEQFRIQGADKKCLLTKSIICQNWLNVSLPNFLLLFIMIVCIKCLIFFINFCYFA